MAGAEIRPLDRADLPEVVALYEEVARSGRRSASPALLSYFERTFLDHPWADAEIPSLVYVTGEGRVTGFLGSSVRRLLLDGEPIRLGVSGQLVTEPRSRNEAAGAFLMREYMNGPQELTLTDTAGEMVRRIWERLGGETVQLHCIGWVRVLRPTGFVGAYLARERASLSSRLVRGIGVPLDVLMRPVVDRALRAAEPEEAATESLTARGLVESVEATTAGLRLRPAYDEAFAEWLLRETAVLSDRGELVARIVRGTEGRVRGWFVYYFRPGAVGQVLQIGGAERDVGVVLDQLFRDARSRGASAVQGRVEAHLRAPLAQRGCVFHSSGYLSLGHSRDPLPMATVQSGRAFLTRLDAEWWMGHHLQSAS